MKRLLLSLTMLSATALTQAADYTYPYLTFVKTDGQTKTFSVENITIVPQSGTLTITSSGGSETFTISELSKMYFSQDNTDAIIATADDAQTDGMIQLYTVGGQFVGQFSNLSAAQAAMMTGTVYVMKKGKESMKGLKK